jgi:hypothetical protein
MSVFGRIAVTQHQRLERLLSAKSSHSLVFYNILGVISHCGVTLDETML